MPMFIKLLATNMVASNFFGRSSNFEITSKRFDLSSRPFSISVLVKEKNATSAPEIRAEHNNSTRRRIMPKNKETLSEENKITKLEGSGSNRQRIG